MEIRELRKKKGMTQRELADKLEKKPQYISDIENGRRNISVEMYAGMCIALGYPEFETLQFVGLRLGFSCSIKTVEPANACPFCGFYDTVKHSGKHALCTNCSKGWDAGIIKSF